MKCDKFLSVAGVHIYNKKMFSGSVKAQSFQNKVSSLPQNPLRFIDILSDLMINTSETEQDSSDLCWCSHKKGWV